jgi:hypothetical protein
VSKEVAVKGVIFSCLKELTENEFGADRWATALEKAVSQGAAAQDG